MNKYQNPIETDVELTEEDEKELDRILSSED